MSTTDLKALEERPEIGEMKFPAAPALHLLYQHSFCL